ncbi:MAG: hypothetical protein IJP82_03480 [Bacteroidaceae bacterium]|nr:hypothetical protein [Bacteroidaceae bacterium]
MRWINICKVISFLFSASLFIACSDDDDSYSPTNHSYYEPYNSVLGEWVSGSNDGKDFFHLLFNADHTGAMWNTRVGMLYSYSYNNLPTFIASATEFDWHINGDTLFYYNILKNGYESKGWSLSVLAGDTLYAMGSKMVRPSTTFAPFFPIAKELVVSPNPCKPGEKVTASISFLSPGQYFKYVSQSVSIYYYDRESELYSSDTLSSGSFHPTNEPIYKFTAPTMPGQYYIEFTNTSVLTKHYTGYESFHIPQDSIEYTRSCGTIFEVKAE